MTREEFLKKLKEALENDLSGRIVQENVSYYESYIIEEIRKGRTESEVIEELGDPWIIARSIIDMAEGEPGTREAYYESAKSSSRQERKADRYAGGMGNNGNIHVFPWTVGGKASGNSGSDRNFPYYYCCDRRDF